MSLWLALCPFFGVGLFNWLNTLFIPRMHRTLTLSIEHTFETPDGGLSCMGLRAVAVVNLPPFVSSHGRPSYTPRPFAVYHPPTSSNPRPACILGGFSFYTQKTNTGTRQPCGFSGSPSPSGGVWASSITAAGILFSISARSGRVSNLSTARISTVCCCIYP